MSAPVHVSSNPSCEPIAVVGAGLRLPGGIRDLPALDALLSAGDTTFGPVPSSRWDADGTGPRAPVGSFLDDVDRFDAQAFGISPREARELDPQQRLLLEVGAEALDDAGAPVGEWAGTATGVFTGMLAADYWLLHGRTRGLDAIDPYYATGKELSFGGGRLAHCFDLHGPALTLASACSSSLAAVHLACAALRTGEVDAALAGGVNLLLAPELSLFMDRVGALSPSGRCRPFDAAADGVLRGEGCALVVLKRLGDAIDARDHVHAVIRGSALGHDGHSAGLTVPSTAAQVRLGEAALRAAGIAACDVDVVEAHATGTPLGDPIELAALAELHGGRRTPLPVGSHKANLGHLDAAAGIVGLLKAMLVLRSGRVPPQPGFATPTERVAQDGTLEILAAGGRLRDGTPERPLRAAVSAFGLSGTNAQAIVEAPPAPEPAEPLARPVLVLPVSARTSDGLAARASRLAAHLDANPGDAALVAGAAAARREHHDLRAAVTGANGAELAEGLRSIADPERTSGHDEVVLLFSGQGAQWPGMGADLLASEPAFREAIEACDALAAPLCGWSIVDELRAKPGRLERTEIAQPLLFAVQVGLHRLLASLGVAPAAVVGHSLGEVAAAHAAGALALDTAVDLVVRRGRLLEAVRDEGGMVAAALPAGDLEGLVEELGIDASLAADNGPRACVASGSDAGLDALSSALDARGVRATRLPGRYPFHCRIVDGAAAALRAEVDGLQPLEPSLTLLSTVTGGAMEPCDGAYWEANAARPVRLWPALRPLLESGDPLIVEIGAHPVLRGGLAPAARRPVLPTLRRGCDGPRAVAQVVGALYAAGADVDWRAWTGGRPANVTLPPQDWRDERAWLEGVRPGEQGPAAGGVIASGPLTLVDEQGRAVGRLSFDRVDDAGGGGRSPEVGGQAAVAPGPAPGRDGAVPGPATARDAPAPGRDRAAPGTATAREAAAIVEDAVRSVLDLPPDRPVPARRSLFDSGLDSITAVELAKQLSRAIGRDVAATLAFERPTPERLAAALEPMVAQAPAAPPRPTESSAPEAAGGASGGTEPVVDGGPRPGEAFAPARGSALPVAEPIAVVGMACRLPGATSPAELWSLVADGRCSVTALSPERRVRDGWDSADAPGHAGFLEDVDGVDCAFLGVSPREAEGIDPQQRLFCEVAWEALSDAGTTDADARDGDVGIYVGLNSADYGQRVAADPAAAPAHFGTGTSFAATAGRLSHLLGLRGPSLVVDTACSASLTAVHLASQALRARECSIAVAGGANVIASPAISVAMARAGALAPDGRCKTFAEEADGYGRAEGAAALILRPLADAEAAGDRIHAVLLGSAVNQDGASGGLTIPAADAQVDVIRRALRQAGREPGDVDLVEAHGTGTPLGDPIELRALGEVFAGRSGGPAVGSLKANLGHLEAAAGAAGLVKVVAALGAGELPAHRLHGSPTARVDWDALPLRLAGPGEAWTGTRRVAGVSAFGFTGSNAHVVVSAAPERSPLTQTLPRPFVLPLSGAGEEALRCLAAQLADELSSGGGPPLADVVFTLARRRIALADRAAVVASEPEVAIEALRALAAGESDPALVRPGAGNGSAGSPAAARVAGGESDPALDADNGSAGSPAAAWVAGDSVDWGELSPERGEVVTLPRYPWQRRRCWWGAPAAPQEPAVTAEPDTGPRALDAVIAWVDVEAPDHAPDRAIGLVGRDDGLAGEIAAALRADGFDARVWALPDGAAAPGWRAVLDAAVRARVDVLALVAPDAAGTSGAQLLAAGRAALGLTGARTSLALLTDGAHDGDCDQACAWEIGRVLAVETGDAWRAAVDAPASDAALAAAALTAGPDDQLRIVDGAWQAARLRPLATSEQEPVALDPRLWHAVTGADAPAGRAAIGWLRARGARRLVLGIRAGADADTAPGKELEHVAEDALPARSEEFDRVAGDAPPARVQEFERVAGNTLPARSEEFERVAGNALPARSEEFERVAEEALPARLQECERVAEQALPAHLEELAARGDLATVVHCPDPIPSAPLSATDSADPRAARGTALLDAIDSATRTAKPPLLLTIAQGASTWGALGAAGAALATGPAAAVIRARAPHAPARLLGALVRAGVAEIDERQAGLLAESGVTELSEEALHAALDRLVAGEELERTSGVVDLRRYTALSQQLAPRALLAEVAATATEDDPGADRATALRRELESLDAAEREHRLADHVGGCVADVLGLDEAEVGPRSGLFDLGLDSIMALTLTTRLERDLAPLELPATLTVELPTPAAIASRLATLVAPAAEPEVAPALEAAPMDAPEPAQERAPGPAPVREPAQERAPRPVPEREPAPMLGPEPVREPAPMLAPAAEPEPATGPDPEPVRRRAPARDTVEAEPPSEVDPLAALDAALRSADDLLAQRERP